MERRFPRGLSFIVDSSNAKGWTVPFETRELLKYDEMSKK
jgi:hypothetical protein